MAFCIHCGNQLAPNDTFCTQCANRVDDSGDEAGLPAGETLQMPVVPPAVKQLASAEATTGGQAFKTPLVIAAAAIAIVAAAIVAFLLLRVPVETTYRVSFETNGGQRLHLTR